jgi:hypothetical protein
LSAASRIEEAIRPRAAFRPLGFKQIAAALKATVIIQHDMRDIGELPAFPAAAR